MRASAALLWIAILALTLPSLAAQEPPVQAEDRAALKAAMAQTDAASRRAALEKFLSDFPASKLRDEAAFQVAQGIREPQQRKTALATFLSDYPESSYVERARYQLISLIREPKEQREAQERFLAEFPESTFVPTIHRTLLESDLRQVPVDEAGIRSRVDAYLAALAKTSAPAPGMPAARALDNYSAVTERLLTHKVLPDLALQLAQRAVKELPEDAAPRLRARHQSILGQVYLAGDQLEQAEEWFHRAIDAGGLEHGSEARFQLGKLYEKRNDHEKALQAFFEAAAWMHSAALKEALEKSYARKHGSTEGLHEALDAILLAKPKPFEPGHYTAPAAGAGKVVLAELFTGAQCGPCVAANQAFDGLIERYNRDTVVILEHHVHIPGPDPMTNPDTERRSKYYGVTGAPTAVIDGTDRHVGGGTTEAARRTFDVYVGKIEPRLSAEPSLKISGLGMTIAGDLLSVSGAVRWRDGREPAPGRNRIRLALAEEVVHYTGSNGVHFHRFVVRRMLGPEDGIVLPDSGIFEIAESVDLAELEKSLEAYLSEFEKSREGFKWQERTSRLDRKLLAVVAFVQNDETKEILQTAFAR